MPSKFEQSYFVRLDDAPPPSRSTPLGREQHWADGPGHAPEPPHRRRRRKVSVRPLTLLSIVLLGWLGWAYTTPGGPSARIRQWIDHTRGDIAQASVNPDVHQSAVYFDSLYKAQGSYPNLSDAAIQASPGFGLNETLLYCGPQALVLQSLSSGGSLSRLLLAGHDLGNAPNTHGCPANLAKPSPWKVPKKTG